MIDIKIGLTIFVDDSTYTLLYHATFTYLLGLHLYNEATKINHDLLFIRSQEVSKVTFKKFMPTSSNASNINELYNQT